MLQVTGMLVSHIEELRQLWKEETEKNVLLRAKLAEHGQLAKDENSVHQKQLQSSLAVFESASLKMLCRCVRRQLTELLQADDAKLYVAYSEAELRHFSDSGQLFEIQIGHGFVGRAAQKAVKVQTAHPSQVGFVHGPSGREACIALIDGTSQTFCGVLELFFSGKQNQDQQECMLRTMLPHITAAVIQCQRSDALNSTVHALAKKLAKQLW